MGRSPCCSKVGLMRGPWSTKEDILLANFIQENGEGQWRSLPKKAGLLRCGKSCRLRWMNYLRPGIKRGNISQDEEDLIVRLHGLLGNRWSLIAGRLPGRTDNEIKNYWNTHLLKKLNNAGIHPRTSTNLPKPTKIKKPTAKKEKKQRRAGDPDAKNRTIGVGEINSPNPPETKVYLPKPIRVSLDFPRNNSVDSLASGSSSSDSAAEKAYSPLDWPVFELEEGEFSGGGQDFLDVFCALPLPELDYSGVGIMLNDMDGEYLQFLQ